MTASRDACLPAAVAVVALSVLASCLAGCGCGSRGDPGSIEDLLIRRYRYNIDETHRVVRVVGEVENGGTAPVPKVEAHAILRSASGDKRGENMTVMENIAPAEVRIFSLSVTSHGRTSSVELKLMAPQPPP